MTAKQPILPTFSLSENDLFDMACYTVPLTEKIEIGIEFLRTWEPTALSMSDRGFFLAYSGGKDSNAILELAKMAGVKYQPVYNVTTIDPPELVRYIKREHPEVVFNRPEKALLTMLAENKSYGPPTRIARWCCKEYKEEGGTGMAKIIGVRALESVRRRGLWKTVQNNRKMGKIFCPILYWTDDDVWSFHKMRGLSYCELYDQGFTRLGCVGCPLQGPKGQARDFARWPKYEKLWKRAFERFWNKWHGVPTLKGERPWFENFGSWQELWKWWISGKRKSEDEGEECQGLNLFG